MNFTENDRELSSQVLIMASEDIPEFLNGVKTAIKKNSAPEAAEFFHKIKGIAGSIGAEDIHNLSAEMESSLKEMDRMQNLNDKIENLSSLIQDFFTNDAVLELIK